MNSFKYFKNSECKFFPCHHMCGDFYNCLFCFCPIYKFKCKGNYKLKDGIKDCSNCILPHEETGWDYVVNFLKKHHFERKE